MENNSTQIRNRIERILPKVTKPGRYVGGEWNMRLKDWDKADLRMVFAFPDVYEVGMSNLALRILYGLVNSGEKFLCERAFAPWPDMEGLMREEGIPLYSLESFHPLKEFDVIGFTLQYELSYTNILNMLELSGIALRSEQRTDGDPWIVGGGPCCYNPEPIAPFFDLFVLGEGEDVLPRLLEVFSQGKAGGHSRREILQEAAQLQGVYVPGFYSVDYHENGTIKKIQPSSGAPATVTKAVVQDFSSAYFPVDCIVPYTEAVHDRVMLEVMRGCTRGCRFCQAGMISRPVRERDPELLLQQALASIDKTGYEEISLVSLSTSDYSGVKNLLGQMMDRLQDQGVSVSLPSLRLDSFDPDLAREVQKVRKSGLTFAPEAGTQRLRDVINKGVTEEDLLKTAEAAFKGGWSSIKLYYMIGLPTETDEDLDGIVEQARKVLETGKKAGCRKAKVTISTSSFVPKAQTPFQWEGQDRPEGLREKQEYLKKKLKDARIKYLYHDVQASLLEAILARGDRKIAALLERAVQKGCKFDGWSEYLNFEQWQESMNELGIDIPFYANRRFSTDEILPWKHLRCGVSERYLQKEYQKALAGISTPDCRKGCTGCGVCPDLADSGRLKGNRGGSDETKNGLCQKESD